MANTFSYAPQPIHRDHLQASLDYYEQDDVQALWDASAAFVDSHGLTSTVSQEIPELLQPTQALRTWTVRGLKAKYLLGATSVGRLAGVANPVAGAMAGAGVGVGLLLAEKLVHRLNYWEAQYHSWKNAPDKIARYPAMLAQRYLRQVGIATFAGALKPLGYGLNLLQDIDTPNLEFSAPGKKVWERKSTFKPTYAWRNYFADRFNKRANKFLASDRRHLAFGFNEAARKLKSGRHKSNPFALIFISLFGTALGAAFIAWLESTAAGSRIARMLLGGVFPLAKAAISVPTLTTGLLGHQFGETLSRTFKKDLNPYIPIPLTPWKLPLWGMIGTLPGWYYQTLINWTKHAQIVRQDMFLANSEAGAQLRYDLMPSEWDYLNPQSTDVSRFLSEYSYPIEGTHYVNDPQSIQLKVMEAQRLPQTGFLGRVFGRPAQFLFRNPVGRLIRVPFRAILLNLVLGIPMGSPLGLTILGLDWGSQVLNNFPAGQKISRGMMWGAVAGAQVANLLNLPIPTGLVIGSLTGGALSGLNVLSGITSSAVRMPAQTVGPYGGIIVGKELDINLPGYRYPIWETVNPAAALRQKFAFLNRPAFSRLMGFLEKNPRFLQSLKHLRYAKGAAVGALLAIQASYFFGLPLQFALPAGAALGMGSQYAWTRWIAPRLPGLSIGISNFFKFVGKNIIAPISGFISGLDIANAVANMIQHGITTQAAVQLGLGVAISAGTIAVFGASNPIGWIIVGTGILLEAGFQIFAGKSFFNWVWQKISPLFRGLAAAAGQIISSLLMAFVGFIGAIFARTPEEMIKYAIMAGVSIMTIGTTILSFTAASGFFSGTSTEARRLATGILHFKIEKQLLSLIKDSADQITGANYQFTYSYPDAVLDLDDGTPLTATDVKIVDQFLSPSSLTSADFIPPPSINSSNQIIIDGLPSIDPLETNQVNLTINFAQPLHQLLADHHSTKICNQALFQATFAGSIPNPRVYSPIICLNDQGQVTDPPAELIAQNLAKLIAKCYQQYCGTNSVSARDFDPECSEYDELKACLSLAISVYQISPFTLAVLKASATDPSGTGYLTSVGFITAVEIEQGHHFNYDPDCTPGYQPIPASSGLPGDIIISGNTAWGTGPIGVVTSLSPSVYTYVGVNPDLDGYVKSMTITFSAVSHLLRYNPSYTCP